MKIAIIGPSPIPFTMGGAEYFITGLAENIKTYTNHSVELIKIPIKEDDFWSLIDAYKRFFFMDLSHFDLIISTKYPAWMVQHENHICYMLHCLRGLYDTYHLMNQPELTDNKCDLINNILKHIRTSAGNAQDIKIFFNMISALEKESDAINSKYFAFPGPFIREIMHYLDQAALKNVKSLYVISETVKNRTEYFPENAEVKVLYPPSHREKNISKNYDHIFIIGRLDGPKRLDLLIKAMNYVKSDITLYIAGTGPEEDQLKKLAKKDKRIKFLGFISDDEAKEYYANSKFIPYFPYDEDYGFITIEAMQNSKIVLTTDDSGGPAEFVTHGKNGFICAADPKHIGKCINTICALTDEELEQMGRSAQKTVHDINWENCIDKLKESFVLPEQKKHMLVLSTYECYPPRHGGQERIYYLYKNLSKFYDITLLCLTTGTSGSKQITPSFREIKIPYSKSFNELNRKITAKSETPISDVLLFNNYHLNEEFVAQFKELSKNSDIVVLTHPYLYNATKLLQKSVKIYYDSHNMEYNLKKSMLNLQEKHHHILDDVFKYEKELIEQANIVYACGENDIKEYVKTYNSDASKMISAPNGFELEKNPFIPIKERLKLKRQYGLLSEKIVIFIGSWHKPNLDACEEIFKIAQKTKNVKYLIIGNQCNYFKGKEYPDNVFMMGLVSEEEKEKLFKIADIAINPMLTGSGTNLKMFAYMAWGIPVIATDVGARGINPKFIKIAGLENFHEEINKCTLIHEEHNLYKARQYVEENFDWASIASSLADVLLDNQKRESQ